MHTTGTLAVVYLEFTILHPHTVGRTEVDHFLLDIEWTPVAVAMCPCIGLELTTYICLYCLLVDPYIVPPGTNDGAVRTCNSCHAVVGATRDLKLKLVGECRPVKLVLIGHGKIVADVLGIDTGPFTPGLTHAA